MKRIAICPQRERVRVTCKGETIADTHDALRMEEMGHPPVYYLPRRDVNMKLLARSAHKTHCPYKGDASYYSIADGPSDAAWSYESPLQEVEEIAGHLAFYPDKVDAISVSDD